MNNYQRGIYEPVLDNIPVYDLTQDDPEEERSRRPLLIIIGLVMMATFAGVVWLAYNQGVERGRAGATLVIAPPAGPARTAPADAGGGTDLTNLSIYGQPVTPAQEVQASNLVRPAVPASPPAPAAAPVTAPAATPVTAPVTRPAIAAAPAPAPVTTEAPPVRLNPGPPPVTPAAPAIAATAPTGLAAAGGAVLQIGSYESAALATAAWKNFQTRYSDISGGWSDDVQRADLGARGIWFRLRAGPFANKSAAAEACEKLKLQGGTCFVTSP
jgi:SPOR domain